MTAPGAPGVRGAWVLAAVTGLLAGAIAATVMLTGDEGPTAPEAVDRVRTVFVGDSVTRGFDPTSLAADDAASWVTYALPDPRSPWLLDSNAAVPGRTLAEMQAAFGTDVLAHDPAGVVILGGTNDALHRVPPDQSAAALRAMVEAAQAAEIEVWVVSPPPLDPATGVDIQPTLAAEAQVAAELGVPFVDLTPALSTGDGHWQPGLTTDGVHPTPAGAQRLADAVLQQVGLPTTGPGLVDQ